MNKVFTSKDIEQIKALGLTRRDVEKQLSLYAQGPRFLKLIRPCTLGDGIVSITAEERKKLIKQYEAEAGQYKSLKFVPASGAASRMFAEWFAAEEQGSFGSRFADRSFFRDLKKMPFFTLIERNKAARRCLEKKNISGLLNYILLSKGLNYEWLPKALIPFHAYPEGEIRTALEEHLFEAASYIRDFKGFCRLHVTLSAEHIRNVKVKLREVKKKYENLCGVQLRVEYSVQSPSTNILAVDEHGSPFRNGNGRLVFRPGGHGALLQNLGELNADFIFVKNIDNIVPANLLEKILPYKKMLGGLALQIQQSIFSILRDLEKNKIISEKIESYTDFCRDSLHLILTEDFAGQSLAEKKRKLSSILNRPLRVCGMVRNEGEPGGGPFWVQEKDKSQTLQIVESAHVDHSQPSQANIWSRASYFNPVDMVCCTKNYLGEKINLANYVNRDAYIISSKTEKGRKLKAQEMPGLWNGGMAYWNTVFVELPLMVFNPVKTVYDLLRPQHRGGKKKSNSK